MTIKFQVFASGSNGNCSVLSTPEGSLLIETGITNSRITTLLNKAKIPKSSIQGILISHAHGDHCNGLPVIKDNYKAPVICSRGTQESFLRFKEYDDRWGKISREASILNKKIPIEVGPFSIQLIPTVHDILGANAFYIKVRDIDISIITDTGKILPAQLEAMKKSSIVLIEMNHNIQSLYNSDRPKSLKQRIRKTHLANGQTIELFDQLKNDGVIAMFLAHLSGECNSPSVVKNELACWGKDQEELPFNTYICRRDRPGTMITLSANDIIKSKEQPLKLEKLKKKMIPPRDLLSYF
ncbi:MAG: MBL fold metallo-hydrolase [Candidatus Hodarchaeales archaeon]|jgi:phosphoribosyl 1,2-cyclic phosphodiesterase